MICCLKIGCLFDRDLTFEKSTVCLIVICYSKIDGLSEYDLLFDTRLFVLLWFVSPKSTVYFILFVITVKNWNRQQQQKLKNFSLG